MKKQIVIGTFDENEKVEVSASPNDVITRLPLSEGSKRRKLTFGLDNLMLELRKKGIYPSEIGLDLLILAIHVYAADTRISRKEESQDTWTREIKLCVPVSDVPCWENVSAHLVRMLNFLTGDLWELSFRDRTRKYRKLVPESPRQRRPVRYNKLQLFSGGLDSLIGAIDNLSLGNKPLLISHAGDAATSNAQSECYQGLKSHFTSGVFDRLRFWINIPKGIFGEKPIEDTTRGRSFLFFALGAFAGTGFGQPFVLETPENGLIALNVPLDSLRLGSLSTHTTHPFYMDGWNYVLTELGIEGSIVNLYQYDTKGEMSEKCKDKALLQKLIPQSLSCSSPAKGRWKGLGIEHCGYCLPCLIRRASILNAGSLTDDTTYSLSNLRVSPINSLQSEGQQIRSFQLAIRKLKRKPELAKLLIHKSGPLPKDDNKMQALAAVYLRGMLEVDALLKNVVTEPMD